MARKTEPSNIDEEIIQPVITVPQSLKGEEGQPQFSKFAQGNIINPIFRNSGKNSKKEIQTFQNEDNLLEYYIDLGDINFISNDINNLPMTFEDKKLFAHLIKMFTEKNKYRNPDFKSLDENRYFDYPVESFLDLLGYKNTENNRKEAANKLKACISHLSGYRIQVKERAVKKAKNIEITVDDFGTIPLLGYVGTRIVKTNEKIDKKVIKIEKGNIRIALSMELAKYLNIAPMGIIPDEITTTKNPVTFFLGYDFAVHFNTNELHHWKNSHIRKVESLLKCKDLPTIDHVAETSRKYYEYIIKPFCKGLAGLKSFEIKIMRKDNDSETNEECFKTVSEIEYGQTEFPEIKGYNIEVFKSFYVYFNPKMEYLGG